MVADAGQNADSVRRKLQALPSVDEVMRRPAVHALVERHGRPLVVRAVREAVAHARREIQSGVDASVDDTRITTALAALQRPSLRPVINATGVVLHTNLGRAPISDDALAAAMRVGRGYSNLEFDLESGERGSRSVHASDLLRELLGVEDAVVVNNCAAAVLLALSALCQGREAIVSRGELVEIGGAFRVPDVMAQGGAILKEVGTTNRTRLKDYEGAVGPQTGCFLKVHQSNFAMVGFTESVDVSQLHALSRKTGVPVFVDVGTGRLAEVPGAGEEEPTVQQLVKQGADLVMFSGDKLLGGPQAGVIAGRAGLVERCRRHPLFRALRVDKVTLASLEATLRLYRDGAEERIPALRMLRSTVEQLWPRAQRLCGALASVPGVEVSVVEVMSRPGGGTMPTVELPSVALSLRAHGVAAEVLARGLRQAEPAVVGRVRDDLVLIDVRSVLPEEDEPLQRVLTHVLSMAHA